jgi:hypothetical protein
MVKDWSLFSVLWHRKDCTWNPRQRISPELVIACTARGFSAHDGQRNDSCTFQAQGKMVNAPVLAATALKMSWSVSSGGTHDREQECGLERRGLERRGLERRGLERLKKDYQDERTLTWSATVGSPCCRMFVAYDARHIVAKSSSRIRFRLSTVTPELRPRPEKGHMVGSSRRLR